MRELLLWLLGIVQTAKANVLLRSAKKNRETLSSYEQQLNSIQSHEKGACGTVFGKAGKSAASDE